MHVELGVALSKLAVSDERNCVLHELLGELSKSLHVQNDARVVKHENSSTSARVHCTNRDASTDVTSAPQSVAVDTVVSMDSWAAAASRLPHLSAAPLDPQSAANEPVVSILSSSVARTNDPVDELLNDMAIA